MSCLRPWHDVPGQGSNGLIWRWVHKTIKTINDKWLTLIRVTHNSLMETDKPVALKFPMELEFRKCWFLGREENRRTRRKTLGTLGLEPTTNSTHIRHRVCESNQGHFGERRALSPLCHPCSALTRRLSQKDYRLTRRGKVVQGSPKCHIPKQLVSRMQCEVPRKEKTIT